MADKLRNPFTEQDWTRCNSFGNCLRGKNLIIRSRQIGVNVAESIVINIPVNAWGSVQSNKAIGTAISFMTLISRQVSELIYYFVKVKLLIISPIGPRT